MQLVLSSRYEYESLFYIILFACSFFITGYNLLTKCFVDIAEEISGKALAQYYLIKHFNDYADRRNTAKDIREAFKSNTKSGKFDMFTKLPQMISANNIPEACKQWIQFYAAKPAKVYT